MRRLRLRASPGMVCGTRRRHCARLAAGFALAAIAAFGADTSVAAAHTRLLETYPADRTVAAEAPERLTLAFAEAVDPRSVQLEIVTPAGETIPGAVLLTALGTDAQIIEFALPELERGIFGLSWATVGPDGHRVSGEVVVGVGIVDGETMASVSFARTPRLDRLLEVINGVGRYLWYLSLAAVAGAMLVLAWNLRADRERSEASSVLTATARRALFAGALVLHAAILVRTGATITLLTRGYSGDSWRENLRLALVEGTGRTLLLAVAGTGVLVLWARRLGRAPSAQVLLQSGLGVLALIALGASASHTATLSEDPFGTWVSTLHLAAASAWLGPLLIVGGAVVSSAWRQRPAGERSVALASFFGRFAPVAAGAFVVLMLTGIRSAWLLAGPELLGGSGYATVLLVKLGLLALVVVPLALYHDRRTGWLAQMGHRFGKPTSPVSSRSVGLEMGALGAVLAVAALLSGMNPAILETGDRAFPPLAADAGAASAFGEDGQALLGREPPASAAECASRTVGRANCYRDYFAEIMRNKGADAAVAEVDALSKTDAWIDSRCHQIVHDLGNDAVVWYGDVGTALTYEGSACWSGYYHGVVEYAIGQFNDSDLASELPKFCSEVAIRQYSFAHFNCVHGLGHGIMQILGGDLFETIPYCEVFSDPWEDSTCMNGAFMENMILGQQGTPTYLRADDLVYPCNAVPDIYVADCFATQTSWMLHNIGYGTLGFAKVFAICDGIRTDMVDNCYRALGRDVSSVYDQDPSEIVRLCSLGHPAMQSECYIGAATNTIHNNHNTIQATRICQSIRARMQQDCLEARDATASTL